MTKWHHEHLFRNITNSIYKIFSEFCCRAREHHATAYLDALGRILAAYLLIIRETHGYLHSKNRTSVYWRWLKNVLVNCEVREKTNKMQQLDVYFQQFLNMFRASLCPSSGEQDLCYCMWRAPHKAAPHNHYQPHPAEPAQHTTCSNTRLVLLKMGIMMPETCWESVDNKRLTVASCWFSLSLHNLVLQSSGMLRSIDG